MKRREKDGPSGFPGPDALAVRSALFRARLAWAGSRGAAALAGVFGPAALYLSAAALADRFLFLDDRLRLAGLACCLGWAMWRLYSGFLRPLAGLGRAGLSAEIAAATPPLRHHIGPAADMAARGASAPGLFGEAHLRQTAALLAAAGPELPPSGLRPRLPAAGLAAAALLLTAVFNLPSLARVALPGISEPLEASLRVSPGDASAHEGEAVTLEAAWLNGSPGEPSLVLRPPGGDWSRRQWDVCAAGSCRKEVGVARGGLEYRVEFRGRRSRVYRLNLVPRPGFTSLACEFFPPAYSGIRASSPGYCPPSAALTAGGWVRLEAVPSYVPSAISISGPGGGRIFFSAVGGGKWELALRPSASGAYAAEFSDSDGRRRRLGEIMSLELEADAPPVVSLPGSAGGFGGSAVSLVYEVSDDLGVAEAVAERRVKGFPSLDRVYSLYASTPPGSRSLLAEELFSLHDLPPGAEASFVVKARDFNPAAGWTAGPPVSLKAGAPPMAGGGNVFRARAALEALKLGEEKFSSSGDADSLAGLGRDWRGLPMLLRSAAVPAGEADIRVEAAGAVLSGLAGAAAAEAGSRVPARERAAAGGDAGQVASLSAGLRSFLSKAAAEADAAASALFTGSVAEALDGAAEAALEMERDLRAAKEGGSLKRAKLENLLGRISSELSALAKALGDPAAAPPAEGRVYRLPIGSAMDLASGISAALSAGNLDAAIEKAGRLLERLAEARRVAAERLESISSSSPQARGSAEAEALAAAVKELASDQALLMEDTRARHDSLLAARAEAAAPAVSSAAAMAAGWLSASGGAGAASDRVREAAALSAAGRPADALLKIREAEVLVSASTGPALAPFMESLGLQAAALEEAAAALARLWPADLEFASSAVPRQDSLVSRAVSLAERVEGASRDFPSLGGGPGEALRAAAGHMGAASVGLAGKDFAAALAEQGAALKELEKGSESLMDYSSAASAMSRPGGRSGGAYSPRSAGGRARVPGGSEYVPPEELRRRVLESLREKYPGDDSRNIEGYLRGIGR